MESSVESHGTRGIWSRLPEGRVGNPGRSHEGASATAQKGQCDGVLRSPAERVATITCTAEDDTLRTGFRDGEGVWIRVLLSPPHSCVPRSPMEPEVAVTDVDLRLINIHVPGGQAHAKPSIA